MIISFWIIAEFGEYSIRPGDVILEVEDQNVAGYTKADVQTLLDYCANRGQHTLYLTFVQAGKLDLSRIQKSSYFTINMQPLRFNVFFVFVLFYSRISAKGTKCSLIVILKHTSFSYVIFNSTSERYFFKYSIIACSSSCSILIEQWT